MCVKTNNYEQVQDLLAKHLPPGVCDNARKIEFTGQSSFSLKPAWNGPFLRSPSPNLQKMLQGQYSSDRLMDTIFYEVLPFTLDEMKNKVVMAVAAFDLRQHVLYGGKVVVDKAATGADLLEEVRKLCRPEVPASQQLRLLIASNSKVHQVMKPTDPLTAIVSRTPEVVVEFVAEEENALEKGDKLVPCVHAEFDHFLTPFGTPFMFVIRRKETIQSIRSRLAKRLELSAEEIARWKLGVAEGGFLSGFKPLADTDHVEPSKWTNNSYFAMCHANNRKGGGYFGKQGALVIREAIKSDPSPKGLSE